MYVRTAIEIEKLNFISPEALNRQKLKKKCNSQLLNVCLKGYLILIELNFTAVSLNSN